MASSTLPKVLMMANTIRTPHNSLKAQMPHKQPLNEAFTTPTSTSSGINTLQMASVQEIRSGYFFNEAFENM